MIPGMVEGCTRRLRAPPNWNEAEHGKCSSLPIKDSEFEGRRWMQSVWHPTPDEIDRIIAGGAVQLSIEGVLHPVVALDVTAPIDDLVDVAGDVASLYAARVLIRRIRNVLNKAGAGITTPAEILSTLDRITSNDMVRHVIGGPS